MDKLGDIDLFVRVVKNNGLAAAGRELGISPASVTARINRLEQRYGVKLLNRTTRRIALTDEGREFHRDCIHILQEITQAEDRVKSGQKTLSGPLSITATVDLGEQQIAPVLAQFVEQNPKISGHLHLNDSIVDLIDGGFDIGIRIGELQDSRMVGRKLACNQRVLCASPSYLQQFGYPNTPEDLKDHACLTIIRHGNQVTHWFFHTESGTQSIEIRAKLSSNSGAQVRKWVLANQGIALKSLWDIKADLDAGRMVTLLNDYTLDIVPDGLPGTADLNVVYPSRDFLPKRTRAFIDLLVEHFDNPQIV